MLRVVFRLKLPFMMLLLSRMASGGSDLFQWRTYSSLSERTALQWPHRHREKIAHYLRHISLSQQALVLL